MAPPKRLLLCLDAFGTLFSPRAPVAKQYAEVARRHGLSGFSDEDVHVAFRKAFKETARVWPNYGKAKGIGARRWWEEVIAETLRPFVAKDQSLPGQLVPDLISRFSSDEGYRIYPDVLPFFKQLRQAEHSDSVQQRWPWDKTVVGVITNSDDRIPGILESLGLTVRPTRVGVAEDRTIAKDAAADIDFVVLSYDVGHEKPDRRIFDAAKDVLRRTSYLEQEMTHESYFNDFTTIYVGDEVEKDVLGALSAGWHAFLLDREGQHRTRSESGLDVIDLRADGAHSPGIRQAVPVISDLRDLYSWKPPGVSSGS